MSLSSTFLRHAVLASSIGLLSCGGNGVFSSPLYLSVSITPRIVSIPVNQSITFTGAVSNNLSLPEWSLLDATDTGSNAIAGTLTAVPGSGTTVLYTAPPTPPIYASAPITQGTVTIQATTVPPPGSSLIPQPDAVTFFITASTVSVSLAPAAITVPLGTSVQFNGYEVGSANNALTWQVDGLTGGLISAGNPGPYGIVTTGSTGGYYTAPTAMPMSGNKVTVSVTSQADNTKSQTATVTLQ
jgi:hypothetical protein